MIGNKSDLFGNNREEIVKLGDDFSQEINAHFITCSAKSADNMDNLERYIITEARRIIDEEEKQNTNAAPSADSSSSNSKKFNLSNNNNAKKTNVNVKLSIIYF